MLNVSQVPPGDWPAGNARPLALLPLEPDDLEGIEFTTDVDGLGQLRMAVIETLDKWRFGLLRYLDSPVPGITAYVVAGDAQMAPALDALVVTFGIGRGELAWISPLCQGSR
jgi:hypothetical protein